MDFSDILLTVDYDRTLTAPDSSIPERNIQAIRHFIDQGGTFTVNTGRSVPMTRCFREIVPVNAPLLLFNGSAWYDVKSGQLQNCHLIDLDPVQLIYEIQSKFPGLTVEVSSRDHHYIFRKNTMWERYIDNNGGSWAYATPDQTGPFLKFSIFGDFVDPTVASMYEFTDRERVLFDEATAYLDEHYSAQLDHFRACPRILDVHAKGVSKLRSARELQAHLGKKLLICAGDAHNDLTMLQGADYAYCPADGVIADRFENVCACAEGAVADVIYKKIPALLENNP